MNERILPPDPEGQNDERATWAANALTEFMNETGCEEVDALADLLCNLMHWCDRNGYNFDHKLEVARESYSQETAGE